MALQLVRDDGRVVLQANVRTENPPNFLQGSAAFSSYFSSSSLSVSFWLRHTETPAQFQCVLSTCPTNAWTDGVTAYWHSANELRVAFTQWNAGYLAATIADPTEWHSVIAVHDGTNASLYLDGSLVDSESSTGLSYGTAPLMLYAGPFFSGSPPPPTFAYQIVGRLDAPRVFDSALTAGEIAAISAQRGGGPEGVSVDTIVEYETLISATLYTGDLITIAAPDRAIQTMSHRGVSVGSDRAMTIGAQDRTVRIGY